MRQEHDSRFAAGYRESEIQAREVLDAEAWPRAVDGVKTDAPSSIASGRGSLPLEARMRKSS